MTKILHLICSPRGQASESYRLSEKILGNLMDSRPTATVIVRPIGGAVANLDESYATALGGTERSFAELLAEGSMSRSEELIQELESADIVVIATTMHNFTVPVALKGVDRSRRSSPSNVQRDSRRKTGRVARPSGLYRSLLGRTIFRRAHASAGFSHTVSKSHPRHHRVARFDVLFR